MHYRSTEPVHQLAPNTDQPTEAAWEWPWDSCNRCFRSFRVCNRCQSHTRSRTHTRPPTVPQDESKLPRPDRRCSSFHGRTEPLDRPRRRRFGGRAACNRCRQLRPCPRELVLSSIGPYFGPQRRSVTTRNCIQPTTPDRHRPPRQRSRPRANETCTKIVDRGRQAPSGQGNEAWGIDATPFDQRLVLP